ncbi:hypothetical protein [Cellulophaga sp. Z1A5H]|uniref:hypothetical protein n=1 Tax=Cellulophaga sp. Z1A5H TaxID=2687291 RepID=UPI0013FD3170|nr:hypothetical protein [Cellulophaga sp. Z1A5H]
MKGKCQLYQIETELENSHLIPQFAFDYFKKTGGKYMRSLLKPNLRVQDGPTEYLLGGKAEQEFSKRERWFANNIFYPYMKKEKSSFEYNENLSYFLISVLWRVLANQLKHKSIKSDNRLDFLHQVKEEWRLFLSEYRYPINYDNLGIFLTSPISSHHSELFNVDLYTTRMIDATIIVNEDCSTVAVYVKFLRFMIWSVVKGETIQGENIKVDFGNGKLTTPQKVKDSFLSSFLNNRIRVIDNRELPNERQQKKIFSEIEKNEKEFFESDIYRSLVNDSINKTAYR